jgi:hypothetical protein
MAEIDFSVNRIQIQAGECVTLHWRVSGVKGVYVYAEGEHWQEHGVVGEGHREVCPQQTTTYNLRVTHLNGSKEIRQMVVKVQPAAGPSVIQQFTVDRVEIRSGECVNFRWHVEGVKAVYFHPEGARWQDYGVEGVKQQQVCPSQSTTYHLRVIKRDDSVETRYTPIYVQR